MESRSIKGFGWIPDHPDARDLQFEPRAKIAASVDLRTTGFMPAPYDQGNLGSCTANGSAGMFEYLLAKEGLPAWTPSRLFIYYYERVIEGSVDQDSGALVRDALKVLSKYGTPPETDWPYNISKFTDQPPPIAVADAKRNLVMQYKSVSSQTGIKSALSAGTPVVFGFTVYDSFMDIGADGIMPIPKKTESVQGGHCVLAVGYKEVNNTIHYICRNSWGTSWGDGGYFYMPHQCITAKYASDFWVAELVEEAGKS
jgi:C1A family cysteine protease